MRSSEVAPSIKVFYTLRQSAAHNLSRSPSAQKPALVVDAWRRTRLPLTVIEPRCATFTDLARAHDPQFVRDVLEGRISNGFGNTDPAVTAALPWTSGSMISATEWAVVHGESVFSPTSGFHHAGWDYAAGFCTFNGLMVAALSAREGGLVQRVGIIDLDQHFGDGTRDILRRLEVDWVAHYTYGAATATQKTAEEWLAELGSVVDATIAGCDVVLFQAGADPHLDDPLGGVFSSEQLARRDRIVFERCRAADVPVVTTLAGGYQKPVDRVVELHVATLRAFAAVHGISETALE